ncbi:hypothetical protein ABZY45_19445 [Streptomyces sp. NPDC006516]|uniref:hypothetical protein n=1 Tax=Streptomyces sp. NPDC006516 TaxID=3154309 RepID=UPI0033A0D33B
MAQRRCRFAPNDGTTWEFSGEIRFGERAHPGSLTSGNLKAVRSIATGDLTPREGTYGVHQELHSH